MIQAPKAQARSPPFGKRDGIMISREAIIQKVQAMELIKYNRLKSKKEENQVLIDTTEK